MAYPTFSQNPSLDSEEELLDDLQADRASNGKPKVRAFYTAPKRAFKVVHEVLTDAERATLLSFYTTNRLTSFSFVWVGDGVTYTCLFAAPPKSVQLENDLWKVTTQLIEI